MVVDIPKKDNWTYADYAQLPPELRCEIINGNLVMAPAPNLHHQSVTRKLERAIDRFFLSGFKATFFHAPTDVILNETLVVQPDIVIITEKNKHLLSDNKSVKGSPDGVIEITSPGSSAYDRIEKKAIYEKSGVEEYWVVDPLNQSIEVYVLENGKYILFSLAELNGTVKSKVINGFTVEAEEIFKEDF